MGWSTTPSIEGSDTNISQVMDMRFTFSSSSMKLAKLL